MTELKQLRDFAEQVNGIRPQERSLKGVVNNLIDNYKGGGGVNENDMIYFVETIQFLHNEESFDEKTIEDEIQMYLNYDFHFALDQCYFLPIQKDTIQNMCDEAKSYINDIYANYKIDLNKLKMLIAQKYNNNPLEIPQGQSAGLIIENQYLDYPIIFVGNDFDSMVRIGEETYTLSENKTSVLEILEDPNVIDFFNNTITEINVGGYVVMNTLVPGWVGLKKDEFESILIPQE